MENNHTANSQSGGKVLAMYDIRGIQDYIYRTPHIKDAMGDIFDYRRYFKECIA